MPGKTRVIQEIVLDKGVKVLDCPGVVLEDFGEQEGGEEERKRRRGEVMLRNCLKVEEVDDPIAPGQFLGIHAFIAAILTPLGLPTVEAMMLKVQPELLQKLYSVPQFKNVTEFLVAVALTRGRLGKVSCLLEKTNLPPLHHADGRDWTQGGVPDLPAAATMILRDWNAGKIPYHTSPPVRHPSTQTSAVRPATSDGEGMEVDGAVNDGDAILSGLGAAFDLEGLFAGMGEGGVLKDGDEGWMAGGGRAQDDMPVDEE
jgi:nuclear GTP-binding protein